MSLDWYDDFLEPLGICGCGLPEEVVHRLFAVLAARPLEDPDPLEGWPDDAKFITYYHLDEMGLTEHGSYVSGAWPTEKGKALLAQYRNEGRNSLMNNRERLRELLEQATPGPYLIDENVPGNALVYSRANGYDQRVAGIMGETVIEGRANAESIVTLHNAASALLDALEAGQQMWDGYQGYVFADEAHVIGACIYMPGAPGHWECTAACPKSLALEGMIAFDEASAAFDALDLKGE